MAARAEQETIININMADWDEGYFTFGTAMEAHIKRLLKYVPRSKLIEFKETGENGKTTWWAAKVPIAHLSSTFGLRSGRSLGVGKGNPEALARARARSKEFKLKNDIKPTGE